MDLEIKNNQVTIETSTTGVETFAFRVFNESETIYYASSRLGTIEIKTGKVTVDIDNSFAGKKYELKAIPSLNVVSSGLLSAAKNSSKIKDDSGLKKDVNNAGQ